MMSRLIRKDSKVGSAERRIKRELGLHKGSVRIRNPDGSNARSDKQVGNLRSNYDENNND